MNVVGRGVAEGYLSPDEVGGLVRDGLAPLPLDGKRVLVLIPDGTRTMPMPLMFDALERELARRVPSPATGTPKKTPSGGARSATAMGEGGSGGSARAIGAEVDQRPERSPRDEDA